ncbi:MAG TPA: ferrous iron transport protein A [Chromatiales bacterium]|nr:ferrous iron transport protein A [Thiotrichales bacterium]HIP67814.1 ferrous iron transport protein A [Chromatiales bacterium]
MILNTVTNLMETAMRENTTTITLDQLPIGEHARIIEISGGKNMTRKMMGLGLKVGSEVDVIHRRGHGVVVGRNGNRIAIGGGISSRLLMQRLPDKPAQ